MLEKTIVELELIPDPDMYIFFEKDTRGGISYISNKYRKANSKYLKSQDPKQESKLVIYLDANNFYGYVLSSFLPINGLIWIDPKESNLNVQIIVQKDLFSKLVLNILKSCKNCIMIIF